MADLCVPITIPEPLRKLTRPSLLPVSKVEVEFNGKSAAPVCFDVFR